jgi:ubiquinone/menaquinone biosynthesis C-methylase UbiE
MSDPKKPEKPSTYFVQDRANQEELRRIAIQDHMLTAGMGGVLPEQPDPTVFRSVLDVGCGAGGWLIELAQAVPSITKLVGVDVSRTYIEYARSQAEEAGVSDRVEFHTVDALLILNFRNATFDLVNHRFAISWMRTWDWPKLLSEYRRVCRTEGVVRITEPEVTRQNSSQALLRLIELQVQAFHQAGHFFTPQPDGVTSELARLMRQHGLQDVQTRSMALEYHPDTPHGQIMLEDAKLAYRTMLPFLRKWTKVPENYEELYQQAVSDMQQPDFVATSVLLTAWGKANG